MVEPPAGVAYRIGGIYTQRWRTSEECVWLDRFAPSGAKRGGGMRRFVGLLALLLFAVPLGISVAGCGKGTAVTYCNGSGYGPTTGQVKTIVLASNLTATGESLNNGQIGAQLSATAADCVGSAVTVSKYTFATTDMSIADVNPNTGSVCGGSWNRNTGGGIADYTVCTPPAASNTHHTASITAAASGATSNAIQVFVHPVVTGIVLQSALSTSCTTDPGSDCCSVSTNGTTVTATPYNNVSCISQGTSRQLLAKVYANGTTNPADNITCQVGHITYALQGATSTATIDANGIATANQPGSSLITATVANSSSAVNAGFFSTCPPASIVLSAVNNPSANAVTVALNNPQAFTATVTDVNGTVLTGTALEFNSTLPINFPVSSGTVIPAFPGSATITAACVPPTCNTSPFSQIGYLGNGKPITSNGIVVNAPGTASDVLYMGSTGSQYIATEDFTTGQLGSPIKLNFAPNSMVISQDGTTIYMGSTGGLEILNTASVTVAATYQSVQGSVLAVAPNNSYAVITDPTRQTVSLVTSAGAVFSTFNGIGTRAQWTPDSTTLYVTTSTGQLLTYSTFVGWESTTPTPDETYTDVAVTVPSYGAYFAGTMTEGRSYCSNTSLSSTGTPPTASNMFTPLAVELTSTVTDRVSATTDGAHMLGVTAQTTPATLQDIAVTAPAQTVAGASTIAACPAPPNLVASNYFTAAPTPHPLSAAITATSITGVIPASNSAVAAITYTGTGGLLPLYAPATGTFNNVTLSNGAVAPVAGVFSTDNTAFYAGTSGDNNVHIISITNGSVGTDTTLINPALTGINGGAATPNLIVSRPKRARS